MSKIQLLEEIKGCTICKDQLNPNPIVQASINSKIAVIGQAPGKKVHETNIPWNDPSGKKLKTWLKVSDSQFYNPNNFALIPMGFCYPGKGKSGDLPPAKVCAPAWHQALFEELKNIKLTLLIGSYSQHYYLQDKSNLSHRVSNFQDYLPKYFPLPHPSPRNIAWFKNNPDFEEHTIPILQNIVMKILQQD